MDIDDTRADLIRYVERWGGVGTRESIRLWVRMTDGSESWIDSRSNLADQLYAHPELDADAAGDDR